MPQRLRESVPNDHIFLEESREFLECAGPSVTRSIQDLDAAVENCIKVKHGIAQQYIYRGLYAAQLFHCLKSIPRNKLLVLDTDLLKVHLANRIDPTT